MNQLTFYKEDKPKFVSIKTAGEWAEKYLNRKITSSNISYLIQYGRIKKYRNKQGHVLISIKELKNYYDAYDNESKWKKKLGQDLNWHLSFADFKESERTKHVHRLHPYKGKFIPQLVEYFLDSNTDKFKKKSYFCKGDIVLDPFCGSGTTLVQSNELGIHGIGIDISAFNTWISNAKVGQHNIRKIKEFISNVTLRLDQFQKTKNNTAFEENLLSELSQFNSKYFPSPEYKRQINNGEINEQKYAKNKEKKFLPIYLRLIKKYKIKVQQDQNGSFMNKWFLFPVREEIDFICRQLQKMKNKDVKQIFNIILSRTVRSCRATTHADLGTLKQPVTTPYYCKKHGKICKPLFSIIGWWDRYTKDTLRRLTEYDQLKTPAFQICLTGDSRNIDLNKEIKKRNIEFSKILQKKKIKGIFSSPPYVGLIDYHEQHAYSYEILKLKRKDKLEIGPLFKGQGKTAQNSYVKGIAEVLKNCKKYLQKDYNVFLVANDKFNLYPDIARLAEMKIVTRFKRPVLNRVEKDRSHAYSETIFHLKEK